MVYVDTSVIVALLTTEIKTQAVVDWYGSLQEIPTVSDWLLPEFSSAISIKVRTGQLSAATAKEVFKEFELLADNGLRLVPVSREAFKRAEGMVRNHHGGLRAGDSLHLAVALELGASHIATLDNNMAANAKRNGLELIDF